jgi:hypothetical protein
MFGGPAAFDAAAGVDCLLAAQRSPSKSVAISNIAAGNKS